MKLGEEKGRPVSEIEESKVLVDLGCSLSQARVYLALTRIGCSSINTISKATGIHRENLYKLVNSMVDLGLIEKVLGSPVKYQSVPPDEVFPMLLNHKQTQISQLKIETQTIINQLRNDDNKTVGETQGSQFLSVSGKNLIIKRLKMTLSKTQISVETITTQRRFSQAIVEFAELYEQALKRGVRIRLATEKYVPERGVLEILGRLKRYQNFEVRTFLEPIPAIVDIFDGQEAHISLSATAVLAGAEGLWSNNNCFVSVAQTYFEEKWKNTSVFDFS